MRKLIPTILFFGYAFFTGIFWHGYINGGIFWYKYINKTFIPDGELTSKIPLPALVVISFVTLILGFLMLYPADKLDKILQRES